jgi:hypothetical protein
VPQHVLWQPALPSSPLSGFFALDAPSARFSWQIASFRERYGRNRAEPHIMGATICLNRKIQLFEPVFVTR